MLDLFQHPSSKLTTSPVGFRNKFRITSRRKPKKPRNAGLSIYFIVSYDIFNFFWISAT
jgi:hypothetical protein